MAKLGSPQTTKFSIGTAELRIGPMTDALRLTQGHSVGLIDNANVEVNQESVDLTGGFPQILVDTAVISQEASITATLREYSRRNMQVMMGEGVVAEGAEPVDAATTVDGAAAIGAVVIPVTDETVFATGDIIVVYSAASSEEVTVARVEDVATPGEIALDANTPLLFAVVATDHVYKANQVAIGNIQETNYFSVQMLQLERSTGRPVGFDFWKATIGAGMTFATNADDFASTELQLKLLQPAFSEYEAAGSGDLEHLSDIIPDHPTGMYFGGGD